MIRQTDRVHALLAEVVRPGETVVDATAGNGHDTLHLARLVGPTGRVIAFDVQPSALAATSSLLKDHGLSHVELVQADHARLAEWVKVPIAACTFNLGYLPGGDHQITTSTASTITALKAATNWLRPGGRITTICYVGHPAGQDETAAVLAMSWSLDRHDWQVDWIVEEKPLAPRLCLFRRLS
jgi:tRNA G37 N-methylase Trm5